MSHGLEVSAFSRRLVDWIARRPVLALAVGLAVVAAFVPGLGRLKADFTHRSFFWDDDPYLQAFDAFERRFGNDDALIVAVHSPSGVFDLETAALLAELTDRMWKLPEVIRVDSLSNFNWVHAAGDDIQIEPFFPAELTPDILEERRRIALAHEILPGYLVSRDARTAMVFARIKPGITAPPDAPAIMAATSALIAEVGRGDHIFHVSGGPAVTYAFQASTETDLARLVPLLLGITALLIALTLRTVIGVLLPFIVAFAAILSAFGTAGFLGIQISTVTSALPNILIAVCIADSVHILAAFYRATLRGMSRRDAAHYALLKNVKPTLLTSITTSFGFISFITADLKPISGLGVLAAVGTLVAWLVTYLVLGPLMFLLPLGRARLAPQELEAGERVSSRTVDLIARRRGLIFAVSAVFTVVAIAGTLKNEINSNPLKYFAADVPIRQASDFIEANVGGARGIEIVVDSKKEEGIKDPSFLRKVEALTAWIESDERVARAVSIIDILKSSHRSLHGDDPGYYRLADDAETIGQELLLYAMGLSQGMDLNDRMTVKNDALRISVLWKIPTSRDVMQKIADVEAKGRELGLDVAVTGKSRLYDSTNDYVVHSFASSVLIAIVLIGATMIFALRSLRLGFVSMVSNLLPLLAGGLLLYAMGQPLDIGTVLVASVCLGIAVDGSIHILTSFQRQVAAGASTKEAMTDVFMHTGPALISTTIVLVAGFGVFALGSFMPNVYFGILTAAVLGVALIAQLVLLPAMVLEGATRPESPRRAIEEPKSFDSPRVELRP